MNGRGHSRATRLVLASGLPAVAFVALLLVSQPAGASSAVVTTPAISVGMNDAANFLHDVSSSDPGPSCSANVQTVRFPGPPSCDILQPVDRWGVSYGDPTRGGAFVTAPCMNYSPYPRAYQCDPFESPAAKWRSTGFSVVTSPPSITANSRWEQGAATGALQVRHRMTPTLGPTDNRFVQVEITFTNPLPSGTMTDLHYRRVFTFWEMRTAGSTYPGGGATPSLATYTKVWLESAPGYPAMGPPTLYCSTNGGYTHGAPGTDCMLAEPDAWTTVPELHCQDDGHAVVPPIAGPGTVATSLLFPAGHKECGQGALFEFALGDLAPGQSRTITMYIGGLLGGVAPARTALAGLGAEYWAIGEPGTMRNDTWATIAIGFKGLYPPDPSIAWSAPIPAWSASIPAPYVPGTTVCLGDAVTLSGTVSLGSWPLTSSSWDFGDGSTTTYTPGPGSPSHTYAAPGTYTIVLTATDTNGFSGTASRALTVLDCSLPPKAVLSWTGGGVDCVDNRVTFDATASVDPDGGALTYAWDFGDGATATGATAVHQYTVVGPVTVRLTVTDDEGDAATATQTVTAKGDPNCPPVLDALPELWVMRGQVITVLVHATDADGPVLFIIDPSALAGALAYSGTAFEASGTFTFSVPNLEFGTYEFPFWASDGIATDTKDLVLHVGLVTEDMDHDGVRDAADNCPAAANRDQLDTDHDGIGDACSPSRPAVVPTVTPPRLGGSPTDRDGDGVKDAADDCPAVPDPPQADQDGDGLGDACDPDRDGDGVRQDIAAGLIQDNCPSVANTAQTDADADGLGDACDDATGTAPVRSARSATPLDTKAASLSGAWYFVGTLAVGLTVILLAFFARRSKERDARRQGIGTSIGA